MWYVILGVALVAAVFMWQFYKIWLHAYVAFMVSQDVRQPTTDECREWFHKALQHLIGIKR